MARWATLRKFTEGEDIKGPREEILSIQERDGSAPSIPPTREPKYAKAYSIIKVGPKVKAGMIRGGQLEATEGFGFQ